jgi:hypothetical protein
MNHEHLPDELLWADGGHASDIVLTAIADGQLEIVPPAARAHIESCAACMGHLGNAALLSLHAGRELAARSQYDASLADKRMPLPRLAIALGLAVALVGLLPELGRLRSFLTTDAPLIARGAGTVGRSLVEGNASAGLLLTYGTSALLVAMGFVLVRLLPKKETPR